MLGANKQYGAIDSLMYGLSEDSEFLDSRSGDTMFLIMLLDLSDGQTEFTASKSDINNYSKHHISDDFIKKSLFNWSIMSVYYYEKDKPVPEPLEMNIMGVIEDYTIESESVHIRFNKDFMGFINAFRDHGYTHTQALSAMNISDS